MVSISNFQAAFNILEALTTNTPISAPLKEFEEDFKDQHPITTMLKILHLSALEGTAEQKAFLSVHRHKIKALNTLLTTPSFSEEVIQKLGIQLGAAAHDIQDIQIALPPTKWGRLLDMMSLTLRIILTVAIDILLLPIVLFLILIACFRPNFNPSQSQIKKDKVPIILIHGSGFNETEWIAGRQFLKKTNYGSVFSLNYDGLLSNDSTKGIEDYAREKVRTFILEVKKSTGQNKAILIGHSMGGLIAGCYAEEHAETDGMIIEHVISIASPWQGTPLIDALWKLGGSFAKEKETKRYLQMSVFGGTNEEPNFRRNLVSKAIESERKGLRKYYSIWSTTDYAVPGSSGRLTEDPSRQHRLKYIGHYASVAWPTVWLKTRYWLDKIYH